MKKKLDVRLYRRGRTLFGWIEHMDESFRRQKPRVSNVLAKNGRFSIVSSGFPGIYEKTLCVRGERKEYDDRIFTYDFDTEEEAIEAAENFKRLIDEINDVLPEDDLLTQEPEVVRVI